MADEPAVGLAEGTVATEVPAVVAPAIAPAAETPASPLADAPAAEAAAAPVTDRPADAPAADKPAEAPAVETPAVTYTDFTFPEGMKADTETLGKVNEVFAEFKLPQEGAQKFIDLHVAELNRHTAAMAEHQQKVWSDFNQAEIARFNSDPEIGGNRRETTLNEARFGIAQCAGTAAQLKDFRDRLNSIGTHASEIRAWAEAGRRINQIYTLTGTDNWRDAMKKLSEPAAPDPHRPAGGANSGSAADKRYSRNSRA